MIQGEMINKIIDIIYQFMRIKIIILLLFPIPPDFFF